MLMSNHKSIFQNLSGKTATLKQTCSASLLSLVIVCSALPSFTVSARDFSKVEVKATQANGDVYMLTGSGGNIGVLATKDGLVMIDDQFAPLANKIEQAMNDVAEKNNQSAEIKYIINTHYHGDHSGGNSYFSHKAPIIAHKNVRNRLANKKDAKKETLPVVAYEKGIDIYIGDEKVTLTHLPSGHTDGDTIVYFNQANVLHTGDLYFQLGFPYVDLNGGGTVKGYLKNMNYMIENTPDDVIVIPGHGVISNKQEMRDYAAMLSYSIKHVEAQLANGKTEQEIVENGIGEKYKRMSWRFITEKKWLKTLVKDLAQ